ncbi:MAG: hypothetical protein ABI361_05980 [Nitrososphaera sp.]
MVAMLEIHMLELAQGIRDYLISSGLTVESILNSTPSELASILGIELYVAKLIFGSAKKAAGQSEISERTLQMLSE